MVMTTNRKNGYFPDRSNVENCLRASPEPGPFLRCPVSTPQNSHRPMRHKIPESLAFVSLDFSKVKSFPKIPAHRGPQGFKTKGNRQLIRNDNLARQKNFDYYYVDKRFQNRLAANSNSQWLRSLCSQPVPEIFGKYRRHGEMLDEPIKAATRSFSTPGERSILEGWDLNSRRGRREHSAFSMPTKTGTPTSSNSPQLTIITRSCTNANLIPTITKTESRGDSLPRALLTPKVEDSSDEETEETVVQKTPEPTPQPTVTPRTSPIKREQISEIRLPTGFSPLIDESLYDHYERKDTKLPEINPTRASVNRSSSIPRHVNLEPSHHVTMDTTLKPIDNGPKVNRRGSPVLGKSGYIMKKHKTSILSEVDENIYNFG